jgi:predicted DsbA family dithiol-disulfide isomerase
MRIEDLFAGRNVNISEMRMRLKAAADQAGLPLTDRDKVYNSRLAQELGVWADIKGRGDEFHLAVFKSYFADGDDIGDISILVDLAASVNLPGEEAREVLESRQFSEAVDSSWERSRQIGITAVPTFLIGNRPLVGAQPYEVLKKFIMDSERNLPIRNG